MTYSADYPMHGFAVRGSEKDGPIDVAALFRPDETGIGKAVITAIVPVLSKGLTQWFLEDSEMMLMPDVPEKQSACPLRFSFSFDVPRTKGSMYSRYFNMRDILLAAVNGTDLSPDDVVRVSDALTTLANDMLAALRQQSED